MSVETPISASRTLSLGKCLVQNALDEIEVGCSRCLAQQFLLELRGCSIRVQRASRPVTSKTKNPTSGKKKFGATNSVYDDYYHSYYLTFNTQYKMPSELEEVRLDLLITAQKYL